MIRLDFSSQVRAEWSIKQHAIPIRIETLQTGKDIKPMKQDNPDRTPSFKTDKTAGPPDPAKPDRRVVLVHELLGCAAHLQRQMTRICGAHGLKQQAFSLLNEIVCHGPMSQKEAGTRLLLEKSNISKITGLLLEKRLITAAQDSHDRRITLLVETPEGKQVWQDCAANVNAVFPELLPGLSFEEAGQGLSLLRKLRKNFARD